MPRAERARDGRSLRPSAVRSLATLNPRQDLCCAWSGSFRWSASAGSRDAATRAGQDQPRERRSLQLYTALVYQGPGLIGDDQAGAARGPRQGGERRWRGNVGRDAHVNGRGDDAAPIATVWRTMLVDKQRTFGEHVVRYQRRSAKARRAGHSMIKVLPVALALVAVPATAPRRRVWWAISSSSRYGTRRRYGRARCLRAAAEVLPSLSSLMHVRWRPSAVGCR